MVSDEYVDAMHAARHLAATESTGRDGSMIKSGKSAHAAAEGFHPVVIRSYVGPKHGYRCQISTCSGKRMVPALVFDQ